MAPHHVACIIKANGIGSGTQQIIYTLNETDANNAHDDDAFIWNYPSSMMWQMCTKSSISTAFLDVRVVEFR